MDEIRIYSRTRYKQFTYDKIILPLVRNTRCTVRNCSRFSI